jgi:hypothetical protein
MSDELRFKRKNNIAGAACYVLLLTVSLAVFGSIAGIDFLRLTNDFFGSVAKALQGLLGIF